MDKYFPVCLACGWGEVVRHTDQRECPKCGSLLLYGCPVCGTPFSFRKQKFCGRAECPVSDIPINIVLDKVRRGELEPRNFSALKFAKPFMDEETYQKLFIKLEEKQKEEEEWFWDILLFRKKEEKSEENEAE